MRTILYYLLVCCFLYCFLACASNPSTNQEKIDYTPLSTNTPIKDYVEKQIVLEGKIAIEIYQHMMKSSLEQEDHIYIDYHKNKQVVAYYSQLKIPKDDKTHKFYGTVKKISGAGKGGGTHTEYYLDLDRIQ